MVDNQALSRDARRIALLADAILLNVGAEEYDALTLRWLANEASALSELARKISADAENELARRAGQWTPE